MMAVAPGIPDIETGVAALARRRRSGAGALAILVGTPAECAELERQILAGHRLEPSNIAHVRSLEGRGGQEAVDAVVSGARRPRGGRGPALPRPAPGRRPLPGAEGLAPGGHRRRAAPRWGRHARPLAPAGAACVRPRGAPRAAHERRARRERRRRDGGGLRVAERGPGRAPHAAGPALGHRRHGRLRQHARRRGGRPRAAGRRPRPHRRTTDRGREASGGAAARQAEAQRPRERRPEQADPGVRRPRRDAGGHPRGRPRGRVLHRAPRPALGGGPRLEGPGRERPGGDGGGLHRGGPRQERLPARGRGRRPRRSQAQAADRRPAEARRRGAGAGHQGRNGQQGRAPDDAALARRAVRGLRALR